MEFEKTEISTGFDKYICTLFEYGKLEVKYAIYHEYFAPVFTERDTPNHCFVIKCNNSIIFQESDSNKSISDVIQKCKDHCKSWVSPIIQELNQLIVNL